MNTPTSIEAIHATIRLLRRFVDEEEGLELLEWALLALIFVGLIAAYSVFRNQVAGLVVQVSTSLP